MFDNTLTLQVVGVATAFDRKIAPSATTSSYKNGSESHELQVRQKSTKARKRHEIVLTVTKVALDPLTAVNQQMSASVGIYIDEPNIGFSDTELRDMYNTLANIATLATNFTKLLGNEI